MRYTFKSRLLAVLILATSLASCGYKETTTQIRDVAYLHFAGNISEDYIVTVNDRHKFKLKSCKTDTTGACINNTSNTLYEVTSGNLTIKITDYAKNIVLKKSMYLGSGNTAEVNW